MASPHDALFKDLFSDPADAAGELRAVLPPELSAWIDWSTLRRLPVELPDPTAAERRADLLFAVDVQGHELFLHVVLEHKSREERWTPLQLLGYAVRIWQRHRRKFPRSRALPPVLSVVVHHGPRGWRSSLEFTDLFELDPPLRALLEPYLPRFRFVLDDLTAASPADIRSRSVSAVARLGIACLQRLGRGGDPARILAELRDLFVAVLREPSPAARLVTVLHYLARVWDLAAGELRSIVRRELGTNMERAMTSTYDQLVNKGREQGREEGRVELILELLEARFGSIPAERRERVERADAERLRGWAHRLLRADSLDDVFAED